MDRNEGFSTRIEKCMAGLRQSRSAKAIDCARDNASKLILHPFIACGITELFERLKALKRGPKKGVMTVEIEALVGQAYPEVHNYYIALKKSGLGDCIVKGEDETIEKWMKATERHFKSLPETSRKWVLFDYLRDKDLYKGDRSQIARTFEGRLLQKIIREKWEVKISIYDIHKVTMGLKRDSCKKQP